MKHFLEYNKMGSWIFFIIGFYLFIDSSIDKYIPGKIAGLVLILLSAIEIFMEWN